MSSNDGRLPPGWLRLDTLVSLGIVLAGLTFAGFGFFRYGVWQNNGPGPGLFPAVAGGIAFLCAGVDLLRRSAESLSGVCWRDFSPVGAAVLAVLLVPVFGMAEAMTLFVFFWIKFVEKRSWLQALVPAAVALIMVQLLFSTWLGVRFPDSLVPSLLMMEGW